MAAALSASDLDLLPPEPPGRAPALILSLLAHGLLVLALAWGVNWKRDPIVVFNAEIWSPTVQQAAPAPAPAEPQPEPAPKPTPPPPAPPARELAQSREAEVALEKRRKEEARKKIEEEQARKAKKEKAEREQIEKQKAEKAEKARKDEERRDAALREEMRKEQLRRVQQQAKTSAAQPTPAGTGAAEARGTAPQSMAPSSSYAGKIVQQIRDNTSYSNPDSAQLSVVVMVKTTASGEIRETRVVTSSSNRLFDEAIVRGIKRMGTVPKDIDGKIPEVLLREGLEIKVTL